MDETRRSDENAAEQELKRPDEAIKDLEPDEHEGEAVTGGAVDFKIDGQKL
jgi:hypothetical protein